MLRGIRVTISPPTPYEKFVERAKEGPVDLGEVPAGTLVTPEVIQGLVERKVAQGSKYQCPQHRTKQRDCEYCQLA